MKNKLIKWLVQVYSTQLASLAYEDSESEDDETDEVKTLKQKIVLKIDIFRKICKILL